MKRFNKLRRMSYAEVCSRLADAWRVRRNRRRFHQGTLYAASGPATTIVARKLIQRAMNMVPGAVPGQWLELKSLEPKLAERILKRCRQRSSDLLDGSSEFLGHSVRLTLPIAWDCDPRTLHRYPRKFYADMQLYELPEGVDVKHVWEINRQAWLVDLARHWNLEGDMRAATFARAALLSWIDENPYCAGINWTSGLEVAMRAISWLWTVALCGQAECWHDDDWKRVVRSLAEHADFLEHHLSLYSSPYNHVIGEATALLLVGHWLASMPGAENWVQVGRQVLEKYGPKQFYEDGFSVEQATGYHFFSLGFLFQAALGARTTGEPLTVMEGVMAEALRAGAALCQPDGRWPVLGDVDGARSIPVFFEDFWDFRSLCSLGAVLCCDASAKHLAEQPGEEIFWLQGCAGVRAWNQLDSRPLKQVALLPASGYMIAHSESNQEWLLFDVGPMGDGLHADAVPSVGHGHADMLSLLLFWQGQPILTDSGILSYGGPRPEVDYFRSPAAHSTFELEGCPVARPAGRLAWSHVCGPPQSAANLSAQLWLARGRVALPNHASMERFLLAIPGEGLWIADRLRSSTAHQANWYWQMPAHLEPQVVSNSEEGVRVNFAGGTMMIQTNGPQLSAEVVHPGSGPEAWIASNYGTRCPGRRVTLRAPVHEELLVVTFFGEQPLQGRAIVGDTATGLGPSIPGFSPPTRGEFADILWQVETSRGGRAIAAGTVETVATAGWRKIVGEGGWSAMEWAGE